MYTNLTSVYYEQRVNGLPRVTNHRTHHLTYHYTYFFMTRILTIILLLIAVNSLGQTIHIDTLILRKEQRFTKNQTSDFKFPIIKTGNWKVDSLINTDLKNRFTNSKSEDLTTDSTIINWLYEQVTDLDFEITNIKNGLISLNISYIGCGAFCTGKTQYFTYSTATGKYMTISEIIDTGGEFRNIVLKDKHRQYEEQRKELKNWRLDTLTGIDEETYKWALGLYDFYENNFELKNFALYLDHLEIIESYDFPNAIKSLTPKIELKYKYTDINKYLKIINLKIKN